jgi:hypothetical protein
MTDSAMNFGRGGPPPLVALPINGITIAAPSPGANVPGANVAAIVDAFVGVAVVTTGKGGRVWRTTDKRKAERCQDRAQKNPTANHRCLSFRFEPSGRRKTYNPEGQLSLTSPARL